MKSKVILAVCILIGILPYIILGSPTWAKTIQEYYSIHDVEMSYVVDGQTLVIVDIGCDLQEYVIDGEIKNIEEVVFKCSGSNYKYWEIVTWR